MSEEPKVEYRTVAPDQMETVSKNPGFLRFQFQNGAGRWQNEFPLKNPHTRRGLSGEHPPVRAVFEVK